MGSGPESRPVILINFRCLVNIDDEWIRPKISEVSGKIGLSYRIGSGGLRINCPGRISPIGRRPGVAVWQVPVVKRVLIISVLLVVHIFQSFQIGLVSSYAHGLEMCSAPWSTLNQKSPGHMVRGT